MNWAQTGVMSFGYQFDFHDLIYHIRHYYIDNIQRNVVFTTTRRSKCTYKYAFKSKQELRDSDSMFKMAESLKTMKDSFICLIFCLLESN